MAQAAADGVAASLANITTTKNYQYDANGNLISDGTNIYDYDYHGWLTQITGPTITVPGGASNTVSRYEYDAAGQRFASIVKIVIVDSAIPRPEISPAKAQSHSRLGTIAALATPPPRWKTKTAKNCHQLKPRRNYQTHFCHRRDAGHGKGDGCQCQGLQ